MWSSFNLQLLASYILPPLAQLIISTWVLAKLGVLARFGHHGPFAIGLTVQMGSTVVGSITNGKNGPFNQLAWSKPFPISIGTFQPIQHEYFFSLARHLA